MSDIINVSVTDPIKCTDKFGQSFISYRVSSHSARTGYSAGNVTVERRYNEFDWLSTELTREFPGCIVPPPPEKQAVGRFSSEFVESRRRSLEKFLLRIAAHPDLSRSKSFLSFLQSDDSTLNKLKEESKQNKPKLSSTAKSWFEGTVNTLSNNRPELEKTHADIKIEEISAYINQFDKQLGDAYKQADLLLKKKKDMSLIMFEFGQSLSYLGQNEGNFLGSSLTSMGTTMDSASSTTSSYIENEIIKFLEPIEEYLRYIVSIKTSIQARTEKKSAFVSSLSDVDSKQNSYRKLIGVPGKEAQLKQKEALVQQAQTNSDECKKNYESVTDKLLYEYELFKEQKAEDIKNTLLNFIKLQIEYNKNIEDLWTSLLNKLEGGKKNEDLPPPPGVPEEDSFNEYH